MRMPRVNRVQRVLLYLGATIWFMAFVLSKQRNYQDTWILADIFVPFLVCLMLFLWVVAQEEDNRIVAALSAWSVLIVNLIAGLKYVQPYGNSLDGSVHYVVTNALLTTGHTVAPDEVYSSLVGMHAWLASLALTAGISTTNVLKYGLPLTGVVIPLLIYWICRAVKLPAGPTKYALVLSVISGYTLFEPFGTGFSLVPLLVLLGALLIREYYTRPGAYRATFSVLALLSVGQLTIWHSTTPMLLPVLLGVVSVTPLAVKIVARRRDGPWLSTSFIWLGVLMGVAFLAYHTLPQDEVFQVVTRAASRFGTQGGVVGGVVPERAFQIGLSDLLRVLIIVQGRDMALIGLLGLGALIAWRRRRTWSDLMHFFAFWLLVALTFGGLIVTSLTGLDYGRFLVVPVAIAPFLAGLALWWLHGRDQMRPFLLRWLGRMVFVGMVVLLIAIWIVQYYDYQPLVPKARAVDRTVSDEYVLWDHVVNTAYQQRMLYFAQDHTNPADRFALDITGHRQFLRYFGYEEAYIRGLALPLQLQEPVNPDRVNYFLLHWPGVSGGMSEQVEWRSTAKMKQLHDTPDWGVVYDNGQSFILAVH
jgi:hypothetical protein